VTEDSLAGTDNDPRRSTPVELAVRVGVLLLWATWCFRILQPFFPLLVWGIVIAVAVNPLHKSMVRWLGGRVKLAAGALTAMLMVLVAGPAVAFAVVLVENVHSLASNLSDGELAVPPPPIGLETWPIVGGPLNEFWHLASYNMDEALKKLGPEIKAMGGWALEAAAWTGLDLLEFIGAIVVAGVLVVHSAAGQKLARGVGRRLAGDRGGELAIVAESTIRGVARGVLGVALIQAFLTGIGLVVADVPFAGLWTLVALICCIVQIGPGLVIIPSIAFVYSTDTNTAGTLLLVWGVFVMLIDNVLRPLLMGRGVPVPMAVIFLGAIGGMLLSGIIGLFIGAMILALGHRLFTTWLHMHDDEAMQDTMTWVAGRSGGGGGDG
jgi:predicted PurR-regulated permease PerM